MEIQKFNAYRIQEMVQQLAWALIWYAIRYQSNGGVFLLRNQYLDDSVGICNRTRLVTYDNQTLVAGFEKWQYCGRDASRYVNNKVVQGLFEFWKELNDST